MRTSLCFSLMSYGGSYDFFRPFDKEVVSSECKKLNGRIDVNLKPRTYYCRDNNRAGKTDSLSCQAFDTRPEGEVFAFNLLRLLFPNSMCAWIEMAAISPPAIRIKVRNAK